MVGSLLHFYLSSATRKSLSSAAAASNDSKRLVFARIKEFTRHFSSKTFPLTEDDTGPSGDSSRILNYAALAHVEQGTTEPVDKLQFIQFEQTPASTTDPRVSQRSLEESIQAAVEVKDYQKLPDLLNFSKGVCQNPNPFSFLSTLSEKQQISTVDEIVQSLIAIRPHSRPHVVYSCLLSYILETANPLPLSLAIIQRVLRSGCLPIPQTHLLLSNAWVERRRQTSQSIHTILQEMDAIGYPPDCGTCNYLILSLCKLNQFEEAIKLVHGMGKVCPPDLDSFGILITEMSEHRKTNQVVEMVKEMVGLHGLNPRKETILKALSNMRANRDISKAAGLIEYLEGEDVHIDFEGYELTLEGCLEDRQFVMAGKFAVRMAERGFIPYIKVRQRVVDALASIGESELATIVRQRFATLES